MVEPGGILDKNKSILSPPTFVSLTLTLVAPVCDELSQMICVEPGSPVVIVVFVL